MSEVNVGTDRDGQDDGHAHRAHPILHITAPLVALGATWVARAALNRIYTKSTGHEPPASDDASVSFMKALTWTLVTASTAAVIEMVIYRSASRMAPSSD